MSRNELHAGGHRWPVVMCALLVLAVACGGSKEAPQASRGHARDASPSGEPWQAIELMLDDVRVGVAPGARRDGASPRTLAAVLPGAARDVRHWRWVIARAADGRELVVGQPAMRYPNARFELRREAAGKAPTLWLGTGGEGQRLTPIRSLPGVVSVHVITKVRAKSTRDGGGESGPVVSIEVGGNKVQVPWKSLARYPRSRPRGVRKAGHRLRDVIATHTSLSRVRRVTLMSDSKQYQIDGAALRGDQHIGLLWRNRRGLLRFRHYDVTTRAKSKTGAPRELGGLRGVVRILVDTSDK